MTKIILIVDDTPNNLRLLFTYLKNCRYKLLCAQSGTSAIKIAESVCPSLILLDVMMPGVDGFAVYRHLKANPCTKDIPIIFMTGRTDLPSQLEGFQLGTSDYLIKPLEEQELLARIRTHL